VQAQQLHLFDPARPLLERFGAAFFKAAPPKPGIYIMSGAGERVLYIGQSNNLRKRLGAYKNARLDRAPRKIVRLAHSVRSVVWEECESADAARLRETQLLRVHRPRFNVQNTYPPAYRFISVSRGEDWLELSLGPEPKSEGKAYGAFKSGCAGAYGALLRLLWAVLRQPASPHDFPAGLLQARAPRQFRLRLGAGSSRDLRDELEAAAQNLLAGESEEAIGLLADALPAGPEVSLFQRNLLAADLETLNGFYEHSARRNRELRRQHGLTGTMIFGELLDDLLALK
jgi:predicted GIY-YIG superfamily endonuclease